MVSIKSIYFWMCTFFLHYEKYGLHLIIIIIIDLKPCLLSVIMQDGSFVSEDLFGFLTDADF